MARHLAGALSQGEKPWKPSWQNYQCLWPGHLAERYRKFAELTFLSSRHGQAVLDNWHCLLPDTPASHVSLQGWQCSGQCPHCQALPRGRQVVQDNTLDCVGRGGAEERIARQDIPPETLTWMLGVLMRPSTLEAGGCNSMR